MEKKQEVEWGSGEAVYPIRQVKADVNRVALAAVLNLAILYAVVIGYMVVRVVLVYVTEFLKAGDNLLLAQIQINKVISSEEFMRSLTESGIPYLFAVFLGVFFVWLVQHKKVSGKSLFTSSAKMKPKFFLMCLCVFMGIQLPISLLSNVIEACLNALGLSMQAGMEMATAGSSTISMFLYTAFVAPVAEELIYRGFIMKSLQKYGKTFAIVISALLFGVMHMNLIQSLFAVMVGLILGYVAMEYSLKWSMLLHMINNFLFGEMLNLLLKGLDETWKNGIELGVLGAFCVAGLSVLVCTRKAICAYLKKEMGPKPHYRAAFTAIWFVVFLVGCGIAGFMVIEKL